MDLKKILQHDICDHLIDQFTLEIIMILNMVSKTFPDLTKHRKIKDVFLNNFSQDPKFFHKFSENDKLISCIYENKIIARKDFIHEDIIYKMVDYYSYERYNIEKIFLAIINNDVSYIFFCLFVNKMHWTNSCDITLSSVIKLLHKYNLYHLYENFIKQSNITEQFDVSTKFLKYPWLMISLIVNNFDMIANILNLYNTCAYYYDTKNLCGTNPRRHCDQFDYHDRIYEYISKYYPKLKQSFDKIKINERRMADIISLSWYLYTY